MNIKELAERLGLEEDEYLELIELFIDTGSADLERFRAAIEDGDGEEAAQAVHSLKGASGNLGLMDIYDLARESEEKARSNSLDGLGESLEFLRQKLDALSEAARK